MVDGRDTPHSSLEDSLSALTSPPPRRWRIGRVLLAVAVIALAAGAAYYYYFRGGDQPPAETAEKGKGKGKGGPNAGRPVPIIATPARTADIGVYLSGLGTVTPLATVVVRSRVDGQLMRLHYSEGQLVKAGQLLAEIDPRPFQVQLAQAEGQLAKDLALLKNAQLDLERYRTLFQQDSIAKQQLDTQASLVRQFEGTIKTDEAAVANAKLQLTYSRVTAPLTGRIGLRQVDVGNIVRSSDANGLIVITQLQPVSVLFTIPEDNVSAVMQRLKAGDKLPVDAWDRADKTKLASGALLTVDNQIDAATGTVKLRAQFSNDDFALFPNQFVNARMLVDTLRGATVIPNAAVQRGSQGTFVYVVQEDSTVTVRLVKLGPAQGEIVAVESGVKAGESVVTDGADRLREGAKVEIADRTARPDRPKKGSGKGKREGGAKGEGGGNVESGAKGEGRGNVEGGKSEDSGKGEGRRRREGGAKAEGGGGNVESGAKGEGGGSVEGGGKREGRGKGEGRRKREGGDAPKSE